MHQDKLIWLEISILSIAAIPQRKQNKQLSLRYLQSKNTRYLQYVQTIPGISNYHKARTITKQKISLSAKYDKPKKKGQHYLLILHGRRTLKLITSDDKTILTLQAFTIFTLFLNTMNSTFR